MYSDSKTPPKLNVCYYRWLTLKYRQFNNRLNILVYSEYVYLKRRYIVGSIM